MNKFRYRTTFLICCTIAAATDAGAVTLGQSDDFEDTTTQGWTEGGASPNGPTNVPGGPAGSTRYMEDVSSGSFGSGGKMTVHNSNQWTGDYLAAGITEIRFVVRVDPSSASALSLRVGFQEDTQFGSVGYGSVSAVVVPKDGVWHEVAFPIGPFDLAAYGGTTMTYEQTMSNVGQFRIYHSEAQDWQGSPIAATMGLDNISALASHPVVGMRTLSDLNGNDTDEVAVVTEDPDTNEITAYVRDSATDALISTVAFGTDPFDAFEVIDDINGNGAQELALLATRASGQVVVVIRDSLSGALLNTIFYGTAFSGIDLAAVPDLDSNGADELAVLGMDAGGGVRVQARDALSDAVTSTTYYGSTANPVDVVVIPDISGNGMPEMVVHSVVKASGQSRSQIRDSISGAFIRNVFFGNTYQPVQICEIGDLSGDGIPEIAELGLRIDTGATRVQIRNPADKSLISNAYTGDTELPIQIVGIADVNGNSSADVALLVRAGDGTGKVVVRDGATGQFIANIYMAAAGSPIALARIGDINATGYDELGVLGTVSGGYRLQIKDSASGAQINNIDFP